MLCLWLSRILTSKAKSQVMRSGIPNFCAVALALHELGYARQALKIRLSSVLRRARCLEPSKPVELVLANLGVGVGLVMTVLMKQ